VDALRRHFGWKTWHRAKGPSWTHSGAVSAGRSGIMPEGARQVALARTEEGELVVASCHEEGPLVRAYKKGKVG